MKKKTSWEPVEKWYDKIVGKEGHYYHQNVIIPNLLPMLELEHVKKPKILDAACGQGIFARRIPKQVDYVGLDISSSFIKAAKKYDTSPNHKYLTHDMTKTISLEPNTFTHAVIILALQNIEAPEKALANITKMLKPRGKLFIVLNHPCFRVPRQSSWGVEKAKDIQYRRIDRYMSEMKVPIQAHPSKGEKSAKTWTFHHPLSAYTKWLNQAGLAITNIEEWCSDKTSEGGAAKRENRSRKEIPLFMALATQKLS